MSGIITIIIFIKFVMSTDSNKIAIPESLRIKAHNNKHYLQDMLINTSAKDLTT